MKKKEPFKGILTSLGLKAEPRQIPLNETVFLMEPDQIADAVRALLDAGWWHLTAITALSDESHIELLYHFWMHGGLTLRVQLPAGSPQIISITPMIPGAAFYEREVQELFGVSFTGLTHTEALFLADDWEGNAPMGVQSNKPPDGQAKQGRARRPDKP